MRGIPPELIYLLIFVAIFVVQHFMKRRARQEPPASWQDAEALQTPYELPPDLAELEQPTRVAWSPPPAPVAQLGRPEAPPPALRARPRRFSRQSLMGTRRNVQNAVVIATIMGPCRALEPPDDAATPSSPRQGAR
jgi:hypothetical protein